MVYPFDFQAHRGLIQTDVQQLLVHSQSAMSEAGLEQWLILIGGRQQLLGQEQGWHTPIVECAFRLFRHMQLPAKICLVLRVQRLHPGMTSSHLLGYFPGLDSLRGIFDLDWC